jgi:plastocyanin
MKALRISTILSFLFLLSFAAYSQTSYTVQASDYKFTPSDLTITAGDTVTWVWVNGMHTTTSDSTSGIDVWDANLNQTSKSFSFVFSSPGVHNYYCKFHKSLGMIGTITVNNATAITSTSQQPVSFSLDQNYPNPFNPSTNIKYSIAKAGYVTLKIYDMLGNEVNTLVSQRLSPGNYSAEFHADGLPSGIYLCQLKSGNFSSTKKMILMK